MDQNQFKQFAQVHINTTRDVFGIELHFDEQSVLMLDNIIERSWPDKPPEQIDGAIAMFGSFLGEAMIQMFGGEWVDNEQGYGVKIGDAVLMVFTKVRKRLLNGMEDSITYYYQSVKKMLQEDFKNIVS